VCVRERERERERECKYLRMCMCMGLSAAEPPSLQVGTVGPDHEDTRNLSRISVPFASFLTNLFASLSFLALVHLTWNSMLVSRISCSCRVVVVEEKTMLCLLLINFSVDTEIDVLVSCIHLSLRLASLSIFPTHHQVPKDRASVRMHEGISSTNLSTS
jgi:hypothetical protein